MTAMQPNVLFEEANMETGACSGGDRQHAAVTAMERRRRTNGYTRGPLGLSSPPTRHGEASTNKSLRGKLARPSGPLSSDDNASSWAPTRKSPSGWRRWRLDDATNGSPRFSSPRHEPSRNDSARRREEPEKHEPRRRREEGERTR